MKKVENTLIDNSKDFLLEDYLRDIILSGECNHIRIATGYWDLPGMKLLEDVLKDFLDKGGRLDIMIGQEPELRTYQLRGDLTPEEHFPDFYIQRDINKLNEDYIGVAQMLLDNINPDEEDVSKIRIRVYGQDTAVKQFLHAKCYIFTGNNFGVGIVGSSNFTKNGLTENAELNYLESDKIKVRAHFDDDIMNKTHIMWFEELWNKSVPWSGKFIKEILAKSPVGKKAADQGKDVDTVEDDKPFTPYEQYIRLLQLQFGDIVDKDLGKQLESYLPPKINKLDYQIDAVKRCISIMHEHGGFMLADVVGLGKTIIGTLIIKRFLTIPEDDGRERKVLIITPPAIQRGWINTIESFDFEAEDKIEPYIDFITTGRVGNIGGLDEYDDDDEFDTGDFDGTLQTKNYGLIIIDESHKFRNSNTQMYQAVDDLIQKIGAETGFFPYIGLLSATPQNNRPNDLKNQIYLFERNHNDSTLKKAESGNIEKFFAEVSREYEFLMDNQSYITPEERENRLKENSKKIRDCVLADILERRTRTDVEKYYKDDIDQQGLIFPKISGPHGLEYVMDSELAQLFADTTTIIAPTPIDKLAGVDYLRYYRYRAIEYFIDDKNKKKHSGRGNRGVQDVSDQLAKIMQILLVKRLESSFAAFKKSLLNLRRYTENMKRMWENDTIFICPKIDVNEELNTKAKSEKRGKKVTFEDCIDEIRAKIKNLTETGRNELGQNAEYKRSDFKDEYITHIEQDLRLISDLYDRWADNSEDPKYDRFKEAIKPELFNPETNTSGKLVIFTEAIDTAESLVRAVKAKGYRTLLITADKRDKLASVIEENFDANYEIDKQKNDYDVIITTDVLAEGVNLHRANVILNYDTPWNSTRLMQRIGRVNRIGSKEEFVFVYNFMPSAEGDEQIKLVRKAHNKLQSFHILFGEDSKIFSDDETVVQYAIKKAVDGEESPMEKYVFELKQYKDTYPKRYQQIESSENTWEISTNTEGNAYFLVKAPRSARLAIKITQEEGVQSKIISMIELLEEIKPAEATPPVALPVNWPQLRNEAIKTYNQYFVRIVKARAGDKQNQAMVVINNLYHGRDISEESKTLLSNAMKQVRRGNFDIIKKMIAIGEEIEKKESVLFKLNQQDIDSILKREIEKLVSNVEKKQGDAKVILGTIK